MGLKVTRYAECLLAPLDTLIVGFGVALKMVALQSAVLTTLRCIEGPNLWENAHR
jgi:hypothetical protein